MGVIDPIIGHWGLVQSPVPLLSLEIGDGAESSNPLITWLVPGGRGGGEGRGSPAAILNPLRGPTESHLISIDSSR